MKQAMNNKRGASLQSYGLMVGLVAVVSIAAITSSGSSITSLFSKTNTSLQDAVDGSNAALPDPSASASASASPSPGSGVSCKAILDAGGSVGNGTYSIDPDGAGTGDPAFDVYCDMTMDGGGWTLAMARQVPASPSYTWGAGTFSFGAPPTSPSSGSTTTLDASIIPNLNVQHGMMLMVGSRIIKLYYSDGTPTLETGYDRLIRRTTADPTHYISDAPHSGLTRTGGSNNQHNDSLCATAEWPAFLANSACGPDLSNSHSGGGSWGNEPGGSSTTWHPSNCWFFGGGSNDPALPSITTCPSGSQAPFATYTTTSDYRGQYYTLWIR